MLEDVRMLNEMLFLRGVKYYSSEEGGEGSKGGQSVEACRRKRAK